MQKMLNVSRLRKPRANTISSNIFFASRKLKRQVWCESNGEWNWAFVFDYHPQVCEYCEQAIELHWSKSKWIPDFVVLIEENFQYKILIIEVKYMKELLENKENLIQKYYETEEYVRLNQNKLRENLSRLPISTVEFCVVTEELFHQSFFIRNIRRLHPIHPDKNVQSKIIPEIETIFTTQQTIKLGILYKNLTLCKKLSTFTSEQIWESLFCLIYSGFLKTDWKILINGDSLVNLNNSCIIEPIESLIKSYDWKKGQLENPFYNYPDLNSTDSSSKKSLLKWTKAEERVNYITPLLETPISELSKKSHSFNGKTFHWKTIYNWILKYKRDNYNITALLPKNQKSGRKRRTNHLITRDLYEYGRNVYQNINRKSILRAFEEMQVYAKKQGQLDHCMSRMAFYRRIWEIPTKELIEKRLGKKHADKVFQLSKSEFPHGDFPLQSVQIDHTPIDVLVVDEDNRLVTERPYLTIALDSHTRCILGYYIAYDKPSRLSGAMTLYNCVYPKENSIAKIYEEYPEIDPQTLEVFKNSEWKNVYGLPYTIHVDNGSDFTSNDLRLFCKAYRINLHFRPVGGSQYGGYVERVLGTINKRLHSIRGSTFSNVHERQDYPSEKRASFTIGELEARVLTEIIYYHEDYHSKLKMTPLQKWAFSFADKSSHRSTSRNIDNIDQDRFKFDILPSETRTVQKNGVSIFDLQYSHPSIQKYIGVKDPENPKNSRPFRIRYDPRDIRSIFFEDNINSVYIELKCINRAVQTKFNDRNLSLWSWNAIKKVFNMRKNDPKMRETKLDAIKAQIEIDEIVKAKTKGARIRDARINNRQKTKEVFNPSLGSALKKPDNIVDPDFSNIECDFEDEDYQIPLEDDDLFYGIRDPFEDSGKNVLIPDENPDINTDVFYPNKKSEHLLENEKENGK